MEDKIEREQVQEQVQISAAEEAPVMLAEHIAAEQVVE